MLILLIAVTFASCKKDNPKNFTAEDYVGTYARSEDCGSGFSSAPYDITIGYSGSSNEIILQQYAFVSPRDITAKVNGNRINFSVEYRDTSYAWGPRHWTMSGTGMLSDDKTKLTINYDFYFSEDGVVEEISCASVLTRK